MWRFLCAKQWKCSSIVGRKKIGVDWPRPSQFQKICQTVNVSKLKIGVDWSRQSQKGLFSGKCLFKKFLHDWSHKKSWSDKRCSRCHTLRGCVLADVQSREELKMLLQAKRQPGYKIPGRVDDRAYWMTRMTKIGYEKLKDKTWSCSLSRPLSNKNTPLNYQMQKL